MLLPVASVLAIWGEAHVSAIVQDQLIARCQRIDPTAFPVYPAKGAAHPGRLDCVDGKGLIVGHL